MHNLLKLTKEPVLLDPRFPPFTFPFVGTEIQTLRDAPAMCFIRQRFVTSFYFHFHQCENCSQHFEKLTGTESLSTEIMTVGPQVVIIETGNDCIMLIFKL